MSFAYYQQKVEVTEYTISHDRHTNPPNYIEYDPDDEDDLHHGAGGHANYLFDQDEDQVEVELMVAMRKGGHMLECTATTKVKCLSQVPSECLKSIE